MESHLLLLLLLLASSCKKTWVCQLFPGLCVHVTEQKTSLKPLTKIAKLPFLQEGLICQVALVGEVGRLVG